MSNGNFIDDSDTLDFPVGVKTLGLPGELSGYSAIGFERDYIELVSPEGASLVFNFSNREFELRSVDGDGNATTEKAKLSDAGKLVQAIAAPPLTAVERAFDSQTSQSYKDRHGVTIKEAVYEAYAQLLSEARDAWREMGQELTEAEDSFEKILSAER